MFGNLIERLKAFLGLYFGPGTLVGRFMVQVGRITPDLAIATVLALVFLTGTYMILPAPLQLIILKVVLVSSAFLHAHIVGKLAFPKVDWEWDHCSPAMVVRVALYVIFVYAYAVGG